MQRENLALHVEELIQGNLDRAARYYARAFLPTERTDPRRLQLQAREVQRQWLDAVGSSSSPAGMRTLAKFTDDMLAVVRQNHLRPSVDILLFVRGVVVVDATIRHLYGDFDLLAELQAFFGKFRTGMAGKVVAMLSPEPLLPTLVELARTSANSLNEILEGLVAGRFEMSVTVRDSAVAARRENRRVKRIVLALVGVSLLMLVRVAGAAPLRLAIAAGALALLALSLAPWRK
jgi:predicted unusual protein kinase regulating ubiquinone biosynthesis (AarF/ABC1/UbiB family)